MADLKVNVSNKVPDDHSLNRQTVNTPKIEENFKVTREIIEQKFKETFANHHQEFSFEILQKEFGDKYSLENLLKCNAKDLDNLLQELDTAFINANNNSKNVEENAQTLEEFFEKYSNKDSGTVDLKNATSENLAEFDSILKKMSDDEKCKNANTIVEKLKNQQDLLNRFFESIEDKEKRRKCADSILSTIKTEKCDTINEYRDVISAATGHSSTEAGNKAFNDCTTATYNFEHNSENKKVLDKHYKDKVPMEQLNEKEQSIIREYEELSALGTDIVKSILSNENYKEEDVKQFLNRANDFYQKTYVYSSFLENIASFISDSKNQLNISRDKIANILDEVSDKKFSETVKKMSERSAVDENGQYKTKPAETASNSAQRAAEIKQEIAQNTPKEPTLPTVELKQEKTETLPLKYTFELPPLSIDHGFSAIVDFFSGKRNNFTKADEVIAIHDYKNMNTANQGLLLHSATGKYFDKLIKYAKFWTLVNYLESGNKGSTAAATDEMEKTVEERKEKNNTNSLPS